MKKTKILTVLGVLLAMGITACGGKGDNNKKSTSKPAGGSTTSQQGGDQPNPLFEEVADPDGHHFGAETEVPAEAASGAVAYKKAVCSDNDGAIKVAINQSKVTFASGSGNKDGTPTGYVKLGGNNQTLSFKFKLDKAYVGKLFLLGRMDGYSTDSNKTAGIYRGNPKAANIKVEINNVAMDLSDKKDMTYASVFGDENISTDMESPSNYLSHEGYLPVCNVSLNEGVNEVKYTRLASQNMIVRDFVFVLFEHEWTDPADVAATATSIAYQKSVNNLTGEVKIEWKSLDGTFAEGSSNKNGTPAGFLKLNSQPQSISYALDFNANLDGKIYQRGAMDNYSSNKTRTYYSQQYGAKYGNFAVEVNGSNVYFGDKKDVTYVDMLGEGTNEDTTNMSGYSEVKDCEIGEAFIKNGANTIKFSRLDSFNLAISDFVFIGKPAAAHTVPAATAAYEGKDADSHWQKAENDGFKFNRADHQWVADETQTDTESTCTVKGEKHYVCSVCGQTKTETLELAAHKWVADTEHEDEVATTCGGVNKHYEKCSECTATRVVETPSTVAHTWAAADDTTNSVNKTVKNFTDSECGSVKASIAMADYTSITDGKKMDANGKIDSGSVLKYNFPNVPAGRIMVFLKVQATSSSHGTHAFDGNVSFKVNGQAATLADVDGKTYSALGISNSAANEIYFAFSTINATVADLEIEYNHNFSGGYRLNHKEISVVSTPIAAQAQA